MSLIDLVITKIRGVVRRLGFGSIAGIERFTGVAADVPESERQQTDLHRAFYENVGPLAHKWRHYFSIYDRHLSKFKGKEPLRLLEIGVAHGGSLHMWRKYFGERPVIFGIDIDPRCAALDGKDGQVRIGSQADAEFLKRVVAEMGGIDVVIDDGSHIASHQKSSFEILFPLLHPEGIYICEDLHTAYWHGLYEGGYRRRSSFIEIAKALVDDMHSDFHRRGYGVPGASRSIGGIHFYNSIVVIEKQPQPQPTHIMVGRPSWGN